MKCLFLIIVTISSTTSNVTNRTKNAEVTTKIFLENGRENLPKTYENKKKYSLDAEVVDSHVYLDDVMFSLNNQNWTEEEQPCLHHIHLLLNGLQNFTLWAVWGKYLFE